MSYPLLIVGLLVIVLSLTGVVGQGRLSSKLFGEKNAKLFNIVVGLVLIILAFLY